jgi:hypothetical protein
MAEVDITIPVEDSPNAFFVASSAFLVSGPTPDLSLQVSFCEDTVKHRAMRISGLGSGEPRAEFESFPLRLVLGTVKMSLQGAKDLIELLQTQINKTESALRSTKGEET